MAKTGAILAAMFPAALAAAMLLAGSPAAGQSGGTAPADDGCDPRVRAALQDSAVAGVERDIKVIRDPEEGIGDPDSLFDLSCDLFDFPSWDTLVRLPTLPDVLDVLCNEAKEAWRREVLRPFDRSIYAIDRELDVLPGLDVRPARTRRPGGQERPVEVLRGIVGGRDS